MVRLLTLASWDEWKPNIIYGWMKKEHALDGMNTKWGYTESHQAALDFIVPPKATVHRTAYFVACRKMHIYQMIFELLRAENQLS